MLRVLVADDDPLIRELVGYALRREGFQVLEARDGLEAVERAQHDAPALVILDIMLPHLDGFEVLRRIRYFCGNPILVLTGKAADTDKAYGLDLGADDYLTKPFSPLELVARIRALLRRANSMLVHTNEVVSIGDLEVDFANQTVSVRGQSVRLTPAQFRLLSCLAALPGRPLPASVLVKQLYGHECSEAEAQDLIKVRIRRLREKIEDDPESPRYIVNVRGHGYTLNLPPE